MYIFLAIATLVGTPTGGALLKTVDKAHFDRLIVFSGVLMAVGTVVLVAAALASSQRVRERAKMLVRRQ